ncbi:MAG: hypothetical protein KGR24_10325 [Planctomycetes bacterium]|nr:hypothetical protein [Planctomycetota bacterium]
MTSSSISSTRRRGFSMLEVVAASSLTVVALTSITPIFVRQARLLSESRRERIALEELANQAERIAATPAGELDRHLTALALSPIASRHLPDARLDAVRGDSPLGPTITLRLGWNAPGRLGHPLTLVTWPRAAGQGREAAP